MKKANYIIISMLLLATFLSGCVDQTEVDSNSESGDITIGALLPLTGDLSSIGESSQAALEISSTDINDYYSELGSETKVEVIVKDTESNPEKALEQLKELDEMGIKIVIGPQASNEAEAVLEYATENGIVLLSTASTAPALAIPEDNLFRLVPDDTEQGMGIATLMHEENISAVIPVYRNDVWGLGLSEEVKNSFESLGGTVLEGIAYESNDEDLSAEVESLNEKVATATSEYGEESVAVLLCSYGEATEIFALAQDQPALSAVNWYGSDGIALNKELVNNDNSASFAIATNLKAPIYGSDEKNSRYEEVGNRIEEKIGRVPDTYAYATYDALWILTFVDLDSIPENDESVKLAMDTLTESYYGVTGWTELNKDGDREHWNYDIWTVTEEGGSYQWELAARYFCHDGLVFV
jgi:branched-chain amino acid transport system substrate-binding protein